MERYKVLCKLGEGGMGTVYLARDIQLGREIAMKVVPNASLSFGFELELLRDLKSNMLPAIYDGWMDQDKGVMIMEYIQGKTLQEWITIQGMVPEEQILKWGEQLGRFLEQIHGISPQILYRDLKPENIMVLTDGTLKIIDFGAACLFGDIQRQEAKRVGTYAYASPEQWAGEVVKESTDIYSLGYVLLDMLRGCCDGKMGYGMELLEQKRPITPAMKKIIEKCIETSPEKRYQSAGAFLADWCDYPKKQRRNLILSVVKYFMKVGCLAGGIFQLYVRESSWKKVGLWILAYVVLKVFFDFPKSYVTGWTQTTSVWLHGSSQVSFKS